jgi:hypothetical protein
MSRARHAIGPAPRQAVQGERQQGRGEQQDADGGAHREIVLFEDTLENVHREHGGLAADDLWCAEIGERKDERDRRRTDQAEPASG